MDMQELLNLVPKTRLQENHIITLLYNQLCALNFIHSANIMHRDLKPSNFLVDSKCQIMICDFGIARVFPTLKGPQLEVHQFCKAQYKIYEDKSVKNRGERLKTYKQNITQFIEKNHLEFCEKKYSRDLTPKVTTRWYRSPEVILKDYNYNQSTDIWSLGCILGEMINCSAPYISRKSYRPIKRVMFMGHSCFDFSRVQNTK